MTKDKTASAEPFQKLALGFGDRTLVTTRLAGRVGWSAMRKLLQSDQAAKTSSDEGEQLKAAERLVATLGRMKGLTMKVGQMASYLDGSLPPATRRVLARLQSESDPMTFDAIHTVLTEQLGGPAVLYFDAFDPVPLAAGSIGQVHRAELAGRMLAVKVQYPGVDEALRSDLSTIGMFLRWSTLGSAMNGKDLVTELQERMLSECDYLVEAGHQRVFRELLAPHAHARVPDVLPERSTLRVLTTEFAAGLDFQRFVASSSQEARNRAGAVIFEACFTCIFGHALFNADPHPGNYLFEPDGSVTFLDFGCVKRLDRALVDGWKQLAHTILARDRKNFPEAFMTTGMVPRPERFDFDYQWDVFSYLYEPYLSTRPFTYTPEYTQRSYDLLVWRNPNKLHAALPRAWLLLNRLQWGLNSVLAQLGATSRWGDAFRRALVHPESQSQSTEVAES